MINYKKHYRNNRSKYKDKVLRQTNLPNKSMNFKDCLKNI